MEKEKTERLCMSVYDLSVALNIGLTNAYKLVKQKSFYPAKKICGRYVVSYKLLEKYLEEQGK